MRICTRLKITPAIARVILLLADDFASVMDKVDEVSLASQLTVILTTLKWCWLVTAALILAFTVVDRRRQSLHRCRMLLLGVPRDFLEI